MRRASCCHPTRSTPRHPPTDENVELPPRRLSQEHRQGLRALGVRRASHHSDGRAATQASGAASQCEMYREMSHIPVGDRSFCRLRNEGASPRGTRATCERVSPRRPAALPTVRHAAARGSTVFSTRARSDPTLSPPRSMAYRLTTTGLNCRTVRNYESILRTHTTAPPIGSIRGSPKGPTCAHSPTGCSDEEPSATRRRPIGTGYRSRPPSGWLSAALPHLGSG